MCLCVSGAVGVEIVGMGIHLDEPTSDEGESEEKKESTIHREAEYWYTPAI